MSTTSSDRMPLMDLAAVAERLGVNQRHVRRLVAERRIPFIKWGHLLRFDRAEIEEWPGSGLGPARVSPRRARGDTEAPAPLDPHPVPHSSGSPLTPAPGHPGIHQPAESRSDRQLPDRQPGRAQRDDDTTRQIIEYRRQVGEKEPPVLIRGQLRDTAQEDHRRRR